MMRTICAGLVLLTLCTKTWSSLTSAFGPPIDVLTGIQYTSQYKGPTCQPSDTIRTPKRTADVVAIVKEAIKRKTTVKAFGHRHSATDIICTKGIPVDMRGFKSFSYDPVSLTATIGAGMYLHDATTKLAAVGRALKTTPAYGNITVGGAVGTGAHGSTLIYNSSISSQVVGLTIVDGTGKVRKISSLDDLHAFRIHLGLLGIVLNITLATEPLYKVTALNIIIDDEVLLNGTLIDMVRASDQTTVYWFPSFGKLLIANWTMVDKSTPGTAWTNDHVPPTSATFNAYAVPGFEIVQTLNSTLGMQVFEAYTMLTMYTTVPDFQPIYTEDGITVLNPATGQYDVMFAPICSDTGFIACPWKHGPNNNLTFLDNEMTVSTENLAAFANDVKAIVTEWPAPFPFDGILLRFSASSDTYMSGAYGQDVCHFEWYTIKRKDPYNDPSTGLAAYQAILQTLAFNYNGRSHWGKTGHFYHSTKMLQLKVPAAPLASFIAKMKQYDPNGIFMNDFGKRLQNQSEAMNNDPATTHCALLDDCICQHNSDCANGQTCSQFSNDYKFNVCKNPWELSELLESTLWNYPTNYSLQELMCAVTSDANLLNLNSAFNCTSLLNGIIGIIPSTLSNLPIVG